MSNLVNASDLVRAQELLRALTDKNAELTVANERWELKFGATVDLDQATGKCDLIVTALVGGRGAIHRVTQDELLSFTGNYETLSDHIAVSLLVQLFEQQVKNDLREQFIPAARNIERLAGRSSL
jgi:hypothetical protein